MKIGEILDVIEQIAPLHFQESYDNSGLIVGSRESEISSALLCVDITESVLDEAIAKGAGLVISHHPIIFNAIKKLTSDSYVERVVVRAIKNGVALYACHTNLDQAPEGLSHRLAEMLNVQNVRVLSQTFPGNGLVGFGVVGELAAAMPIEEFFRHMKSTLGLNVFRYSNVCRETISRVSICTGSGASLIDDAKLSQSDIYISADFKYNNFLDADNCIIIADIGHFESEYCAIDLLHDIIRKKITTFALHKSENSVNPINYFV